MCLKRSTSLLAAILFGSALALSPSGAGTARAMVLRLTFDQVIGQADLIFVGTVVGQATRQGAGVRMVFTDVDFNVERLVFARESARSSLANPTTLTFAGGESGGLLVWVEDVPILETGARYVIAAHNDGNAYASPIVGAYQGLFRVVTDPETGVEYPLAPGGSCIGGFAGPDLWYGPPLKGIAGGVAQAAPEPDDESDQAELPRPLGISARTGARVEAVRLSAPMPESLLTLDDFLAEIERRLAGEGR